MHLSCFLPGQGLFMCITEHMEEGTSAQDMQRWWSGSDLLMACLVTGKGTMLVIFHLHSKHIHQKKLCQDQWKKNIPWIKSSRCTCHKTCYGLDRSSSVVPGVSFRTACNRFNNKCLLVWLLRRNLLIFFVNKYESTRTRCQNISYLYRLFICNMFINVCSCCEAR